MASQTELVTLFQFFELVTPCEENFNIGLELATSDF